MRYTTNYEPGNGTRYQFALVELPSCTIWAQGSQLFIWLNADRRGGRSMVLPPAFINRGYMAEKLDGPMSGDLDAICTWLQSHGVQIRV